MDKLFILLVTVTLFGKIANGRRRWWYEYDHDPPAVKHQNFNYDSWCNSANGWGDNSGEDSSEENGEVQWGGNKDRFTRSSTSTTTRRTVAMSITNSSGVLTTSIKASSSGSTPSPIEVLLCLRICPITSEYNPVCGTDGITYRNPGRLQCARSCGISVSIQSGVACPTNPIVGPSQTTSTIATPQRPTRPTTATATTSEDVSQLQLMVCQRSCLVTSEYNPLCGTDKVTYDNPSFFECAKHCGKKISVWRKSRCPDSSEEQDTTETPQMPPTLPSTIKPTRFTTIDANPPPNPLGVPSPIPNPSNNRFNFTIPPNVLNVIFDSQTTPEIPDYSVDERFGD